MTNEPGKKPLSTPVKKITQAALIGAVYFVLTIALAPISYGPVQFRVSEALTVMPALTPAAIPGLAIGCFFANLLGPYGVPDMIFGTCATLLAALASYLLRKYDWLVPLPPVVCNALIVGSMLHYVYNVPNLLACMAWVGLGELVVCYVIGLPLLKLFKKYPGIFS